MRQLQDKVRHRYSIYNFKGKQCHCKPALTLFTTLYNKVQKILQVDNMRLYSLYIKHTDKYINLSTINTESVNN